MSDLREQLNLPDDIPLWNGCDAAIIGVGMRCGMSPVAVYDYEKLVACFLTPDCDEECAREWVDFNIVGAYIGPETPIIFSPLEAL